MLEKIFTSKVRLKLLQIFLSHKENKYYQRQLEKILGISIRPLQVEIKNLLEIGFLKKEKDGNRIYYFINDRFPLLEELDKLILKGTFLIDKLSLLLSDKDISLAFIFGSAAQGNLMKNSDIDLFIIGNTDTYRLHKALKNIENDFSRIVNYIIYGKKEILKKIKEKSGFITEVINSKKIYLKGSDEEFRKFII